ncbi:Hypothetical protein A7982_05848 [Minicystis rosea]|nr:Hypothetical protein A7982_05848 [Minicystis rosea]
MRLTCAPEGLEIELIRVTGFALGFAPGGVADPVGFRVPYTSVRGLVREGRLLYLALDPAVVTPYNRFALARFAEEAGDVLARAQEARARARWASFLLPLPVGAIAALLVPEALAGGILGRASVGVIAALCAWLILRGVVVWRTWGGPFSDRIRDRFEAELSERLALTPPPPAAAVPAPAVRFAPRRGPVRPPPIVLDPITPTLVTPPRAATVLDAPVSVRAPLLRRPLIVALAAASFVVIVVGFLGRYGRERTPPPAIPTLRTGLGAAARSLGVTLIAEPEPERCLCVRADSPLWKDGIPVLSVLTFEGDETAIEAPAPTLDGKGFPKYRFDLAIVNNGARGLRDVRLTLTFARRTEAGRRVGAVDRGLFWEGILRPGHAAKWHVAAPGNEVRTDVSVTGTLASQNLDPAPADAFYALTSARVRAARVHGAMMLAYLRDPRAGDVARALAAQSSSDEALLARVRRAAASVIACDVRREGGALEACVFNGSSRARSGLSLREVTDAAGATPRSFAIPATVPVHEGIRVRIQIPLDISEELGIVDPLSAD